MSEKPFNLLKNYLGALSHSTVQPRQLPRPAIAISRESGAGALTVATMVAEELNAICPGEPPRPWAVFTGNLPGKILEEHSLSERIEQFMPEDFRFPLTESFEFLLGLHPRPGLLREYTRETIRQLAATGNVVLVGRGAAIICAGLPHVLRVRLVAPFEFRVRNFARSHGIPDQEAVRVVRANDAARRRYVRAYLNSDVINPLHYDLVINTENHGFERVARIICASVVHLILQEREAKTQHYSVENGSKLVV
ncbi:MAG TPA: cytidylate kinase-like family protein [Chthoniobacterales bacterium]